MELMIASFMGFLVVTMSLSAMAASRRVYKQDIVRTRIQQNLRGAMDVLSQDVREAGENLPPEFPAVEIINGASGAPDELIVRRALMDESLKLCGTVSGTVIPVSQTPAPAPGCGRIDPDSSVQAWQTELAARGVLDAYIYDFTNQRGEFFKVSNITDSGTQRSLTATEGSWTQAYTLASLGPGFVSNTSLYILEEWHYRLNGGNLELIINEDFSRPLTVAFDITDLQVSATRTSGASVDSFGKSDSWIDIATINIELSARGRFAGREQKHSLRSKFFPRNILSH